MSKENQNEITNAELAKLIESVAVNLVSFQQQVYERFDGIERRLNGIEGRLEGMETRLGSVETRLEKVEEVMVTKTYLDIRLEKIEAGAFTEDEKKSVLDTVKLINDRWGDEETGKGHITFTREEYNAASRAQGFPNRFVGVPVVDIE